jgi:hypothetical protein
LNGARASPNSAALLAELLRPAEPQRQEGVVNHVLGQDLLAREPQGQPVGGGGVSAVELIEGAAFSPGECPVQFNVVGRGASDEALLKANDTIRKLFAYRHDLLKALIADGVKLVVLGRNERLADLPELAVLRGREDVDPLARTLGYTPQAKLIVVSEENVLADPRQPRVGDNQVIRLLAQAVYQVAGTRSADPNWDNRGRNVQQYELRVKRLDERFAAQLTELHQQATSAGKWKGTSAVHSPMAYWSAGVLAYFDAAGAGFAPNDATRPITTREFLKSYDPDLYALVDETMAYREHVDWRFKR